MAFLWVAVLLKKCQCSKPRLALCLDWGRGAVNFCSVVLYCQVGAWWSAEKRVIAWVLLTEADEMMLILLHLLFAFFLPNPYSESFWGPRPSFLPPGGCYLPQCAWDRMFHNPFPSLSLLPMSTTPHSLYC